MGKRPFQEKTQMSSEKDICPICGSAIVEKTIDYSDWQDGELLVIRDVPVRECQEWGHRFFHARVAKELERLLDLISHGEVQPSEKIEVPVFQLQLVT
jgi:YgiT-type zinc finger domain-containing protein